MLKLYKFVILKKEESSQIAQPNRDSLFLRMTKQEQNILLATIP